VTYKGRKVPYTIHELHDEYAIVIPILDPCCAYVAEVEHLTKIPPKELPFHVI